MYRILFLLVSLAVCASCYSQQKLPDLIDKDMTLVAGKTYLSNGFILKNGFTLTILAGVTIQFSDTGNNKGSVNIEGKLIIKGTKAKPVVFKGAMGEVHLQDATFDIAGWEIANNRIQIRGNSKGIIKDSKLIRDNPIPYSFIIYVPKSENITIENCLFQDYDFEIESKEFPNDLANLIIRNCAFTYVFVAREKRGHYYKPKRVTPTLFAYGTKCDLYIGVEFKAMNWQLKTPLVTDWYIANPDIKKTLLGTVTSAKNFQLNSVSKKITSFTQTPDPDETEKPKK